MKSKYDYEIIRDYLHGLLDQETARNIRELIRTDEVARNIAAGILQLEHEFHGDEHEIEAYIENLRQKQLNLIHGQSKGWGSGSWIKLAAAILIIALVAAVVWMTMFKGNKTDLLAQELNSPYPLSTLERGASDANEGFEFYLKGEYKNAIAKFEGVEGDASVAFYNGLSNLYSGDYDRAVTLLGSQLLEGSRYREQAGWYRSLALIKAERIDEARESLKKISSDVGHYKSEAAIKLLSSLSNKDHPGN